MNYLLITSTGIFFYELSRLAANLSRIKDPIHFNGESRIVSGLLPYPPIYERRVKEKRNDIWVQILFSSDFRKIKRNLKFHHLLDSNS